MLKNWVGEEIKKGLNENEVITDQQYDDATSLCFSNEFFTDNSKDQFSKKINMDFLAEYH